MLTTWSLADATTLVPTLVSGLLTSLASGLPAGLLTLLQGFGVSAVQSEWARVARKSDKFSLPRRGPRAAPQEHSAPQALDISTYLTAEAAVWVTSAVVAALIAVFVLHRHFRSHHLRFRIAYDFLPTTTFDPSLSAVTRFGHQLARTRPTSALVPRAATAVRIRIRTDDQGKMIYRVEGRESIMGQLNQGAYLQVELRRVVEPQAPHANGPGETTPASARGETTSSGSADGQGDITSPAPEGETTSSCHAPEDAENQP